MVLVATSVFEMVAIKAASLTFPTVIPSVLVLTFLELNVSDGCLDTESDTFVSLAFQDPWVNVY